MLWKTVGDRPPKRDPQGQYAGPGALGHPVRRMGIASAVATRLLDDEAGVRGLDRQGLEATGDGDRVGNRDPGSACDAELAAIGDVDVGAVGASLLIGVGDVAGRVRSAG